MIIGISGKSQSGKDTVGKIIQYLTNPFDRDMKTIFNLKEDYSVGNTWQIHKFANAVKDIVCILTGCTREQLEDEKFKNTKIGNEWNYIEYEPDGINGDLRSKFEYSYTYRQLLQTIGTNLFRDQLHSNTWINALMKDYKLDDGIVREPISKENKAKYPPGQAPTLQQYYREPRYPNWIITDCRFPNEAKAIKDRGGILIRVNRPRYGNSMVALATAHESETALDGYEKWNYIIDNNGTIEELIEKVKQILIKEKLLR
jgi:dephospho-CoA kinase